MSEITKSIATDKKPRIKRKPSDNKKHKEQEVTKPQLPENVDTQIVISRLTDGSIHTQAITSDINKPIPLFECIGLISAALHEIHEVRLKSIEQHKNEVEITIDEIDIVMDTTGSLVKDGIKLSDVIKITKHEATIRQTNREKYILDINNKQNK